MESLFNETTETHFNSTLSDDGILFSSHSVNTPIDLESHDNNSNYNTILSDTLIIQNFTKTTYTENLTFKLN